MALRLSSWLRGWRLVILIYLVLLLLSHLFQTAEPDVLELEPGQNSLTVHQVAGDSILTGKTIELAYRDEYKGSKSDPPVILLLYDSPIGTPNLPVITEHLARQNRVIVPDFPGYDASDREIPDYSMESFSVYMDQLLDSLNVDRVHVVGYSLGAGVAINMAHHFPDKIASIDMLSGLGVQELELLGSYHLNHAVYGGQLFITWFIHEAIPHFGLLHDFPFNVPYARSFYDSDQRPIRDYLKQYKKPMLIQHGREDGLVPVAAAREHHRLVPQSELILYDGGHAIVQSIPGKITEDINAFVQRVETGDAATYAEAAQERIREARRPFDDVDFAKAEGISLYIIMIVIIVSTFFSEDMACIGAGLLAARGIIGYWPATVAGFIGILIGNVAIFLIGRWLGEPAVRRAPFRWFISKKDLERSAEWFRVRGPMIILASRFVPGSRLPTYFSAGVIGMSLWLFLLYFIFAGMLWTPLIVGLAMLVGTELLRYFQVYQEYAILVIPVIILLLFLFVKFVLPAVTWRGRRLIVSRWRRLTRWKFWSPYLIYTPVFLYTITYLWIRFGRLTTFTAANPGIPAGGFIGESKSDILSKIESSGKAVRFRRISSTLSDWEQLLQIRQFLNEEQLSYPVTIKPDVGQRGRGVSFPENEEEAQEALKEIDGDVIVQEFVDGHEYSVFYYRYPSEEHGRIFSITKKDLLTITGDGEHTLEELILMDSQAVTMAKRHMREHQDRLYKKPDEGEQVKLVNLGTHARGARFSDVSDLATEELVSALDEIALHIKGFNFGRFDLKVADEGNLAGGKELKILEVNGVTTESTVIYDPKYNFFQGIGQLIKQWEIAFEIGYQNMERGAAPTPVNDLIRRLISRRSAR